MKHRRDKTHAAIVKELRQMHFSVLDLSQTGKGAPDLLIALGGFTALVEAKTPKGAKTALSQRSASQRAFADAWKGLVITAYTADEIVLAFYRGYDHWCRSAGGFHGVLRRAADRAELAIRLRPHK